MITAVIRPGDDLPAPPDGHVWVWADIAGPAITVVALRAEPQTLPSVPGHTWGARFLAGSRVYATRPTAFTRGG